MEQSSIVEASLLALLADERYDAGGLANALQLALAEDE